MSLPQNGPTVFPILYLQKGSAVRRVEGGFTLATNAEGQELDIFDVTDRLFEKYHRLYLVDVEGMTNNNPQLDYLQELSRGREVWAEAGPRTADQVIDVIVGGALRAVLSLQLLSAPEREVRHALSLTSDIALEVMTEGGKVLSSDPTLSRMDLGDFGRLSQEWGVQYLVLSSHDFGWEAVAELSKTAQVFVKRVPPEEMESLRASGAAGVIVEVDLNG